MKRSSGSSLESRNPPKSGRLEQSRTSTYRHESGARGDSFSVRDSLRQKLLEKENLLALESFKQLQQLERLERELSAAGFTCETISKRSIRLSSKFSR